MPNNIKPSEVSDVLLRQLENIDTNIKFEEVGIVLSIGDGVARIYGLTGVTENELIEFDNGVMAVAMNLEEDNVGAVLLGSSEGIKEGQSVKRTGRVASIEVSESMLGRVINPLTARNSSCRSTVRLLVLFIASQSTRHFKQD